MAEKVLKTFKQYLETNVGPICIKVVCSLVPLSSGLVQMVLKKASSNNHINLIVCSLKLDQNKSEAQRARLMGWNP